MKEKRILNMFGQVDEQYVEEAAPVKKEHKKYSWVKWGGFVACAAIVFFALNFLPKGTIEPDNIIEPDNVMGPDNMKEPDTVIPPSKTQIPDNDVQHVIKESGELHLVQLKYAPKSIQQDSSDFIIHINEELYQSSEQDGVYIIQSVIPASNELPECSLKIFSAIDLSTTAVAESIIEELNKSFLNITNISESTLINGLYLHADNGTEWNAEQLDIYIVDNLLGGSYVLAAKYFTEATEGHGARFSDMIGTFEVITDSEIEATPDYILQLRNTINMFIPAVFSNQISNINEILAENAQIYAYDKDVMDDVSIQSIDYTVDNYELPSTAVVSIKHRLGTEDGYNYITVELVYKEKQWLVNFVSIEK